MVQGWWRYLAPVAGACERAQHIHMLKLAQQLIHGELHGLAHKAIDAQAVLAPVDARHRAMVPHIVQRGRRDKAMLHQHIWRWLHIEGVPAQTPMLSNTSLKQTITNKDSHIA